MRGRDFNTGLRGGLFDSGHYDRMGSAVWLYGWLVLRQTHQSGSTGFVLGGAPVRYSEIEEETGFNVRTLERWMSTLRRHGYVETESAPGGVIVRITKAKKHSQAPRNFANTGNESLRRAANSLRKFADAPRKSAEGDTQNCVAHRVELSRNTQVALPICSSSVEESLEKYAAASSKERSLDQKQEGNSVQHLTPSCSGENQKRNQNQEWSLLPSSARNLFADPEQTPRVTEQAPRESRRFMEEARLRQQLWRSERDDAVRRELRVGAGPEVKHS